MTLKAQMFMRGAGAQSWVQGGPFRLSMRPFMSEEISDSPIVLVVIHGDAPFNEPEYQYIFAAKVAATYRDVIAVGLLRPGYTDPRGNKSDGDRGEAVGDNLNLQNTEAIAEAIGVLKRRWNARKLVAVAHSGGATLAANILGRNPTLIDQALLVSSIYDVEKWRRYMFGRTNEALFQREIETLSPMEQIAGMSDQVEVTLMIGSEDDVAPPSFSERYEIAARKRGKKVRLVRLDGEGHEIFLHPAVLLELGPMLT